MYEPAGGKSIKTNELMIRIVGWGVGVGGGMGGGGDQMLVRSTSGKERETRTTGQVTGEKNKQTTFPLFSITFCLSSFTYLSSALQSFFLLFFPLVRS